MSPDNFSRTSSLWLKWFLPTIGLAVLWFGWVVGWDPTAIILLSLVGLLSFISRGTRQFLLSFSPFLIYLTCYISLKILPKYNPFEVINKGLYDLELNLFGVNLSGKKVILCELANAHLSTFADCISGIFYITWAPFPILFGIFLFFKRKRKILFDFWICFLIANLFGFVIYIIFPAAPPWYYLKYGDIINLTAGGEPGGLARFDDLIGFPLYHNMYSQGTNTFGALPSMHAAFPLILSFYSRKYKNIGLTVLFLISMVCIWFGAVYSNHHYLIDVILGIICAILGIIITELWVNGKFVPSWYKKTINYIR